MDPSPETAQSDVDVNTLLARIEDPKARRAAEDLLGDWERQGFVKQAQIDRLAMIRQLSPAELVEVIAKMAVKSGALVGVLAVPQALDQGRLKQQ